MWLTISIVLLVISIFVSILLFYSLRRIGQYEQFLVNIEKVIRYSTERLKQLDNKGSFESDDEIGFFFEEVNKLQKMLDDIFETTETGDKNG
tara:strand:- start:914 stop:1189 length:276 start_codon:yes stop_codon:yes gene_type:complete